MCIAELLVGIVIAVPLMVVAYLIFGTNHGGYFSDFDGKD